MSAQVNDPTLVLTQKAWQGFRRWPVWGQVLGWIFGYWALLPLWIARSNLPAVVRAILAPGVALFFVVSAFGPKPSASSKTAPEPVSTATATEVTGTPVGSAGGSCAASAADYSRYRQTIEGIDADGTLIAAVAPGVTASGVKVTVGTGYHYQPYQVRLQLAQNLWTIWATAVCPSRQDSAHLKLVDLNGNTVGGSGWLAGSMIEVDK